MYILNQYLCQNGFTQDQANKVIDEFCPVANLRLRCTIIIQKNWRGYSSRKITLVVVRFWKFALKRRKATRTIQYHCRFYLYRKYCKGNLKNIWKIK